MASGEDSKSLLGGKESQDEESTDTLVFPELTWDRAPCHGEDSDRGEMELKAIAAEASVVAMLMERDFCGGERSRSCSVIQSVHPD